MTNARLSTTRPSAANEAFGVPVMKDLNRLHEVVVSAALTDFHPETSDARTFFATNVDALNRRRLLHHMCFMSSRLFLHVQ